MVPGGLWCIAVFSWWAMDGCCHSRVGYGWLLSFPGGLWVVTLISQPSWGFPAHSAATTQSGYITLAVLRDRMWAKWRQNPCRLGPPHTQHGDAIKVAASSLRSQKAESAYAGGMQSMWTDHCSLIPHNMACAVAFFFWFRPRRTGEAQSSEGAQEISRNQ